MSYAGVKIAAPIAVAEYNLENAEGQLRRELIAQVKEQFKILPDISNVIKLKKDIIVAERKLGYLQHLHGELIDIFVYCISIPLYFANKITFGTMFQLNQAILKFMQQITFFLSSRESLIILRATAKRIRELG